MRIYTETDIYIHGYSCSYVHINRHKCIQRHKYLHRNEYSCRYVHIQRNIYIHRDRYTITDTCIDTDIVTYTYIDAGTDTSI